MPLGTRIIYLGVLGFCCCLVPFAVVVWGFFVEVFFWGGGGAVFFLLIVGLINEVFSSLMAAVSSSWATVEITIEGCGSSAL